MRSRLAWMLAPGFFLAGTGQAVAATFDQQVEAGVVHLAVADPQTNSATAAEGEIVAALNAEAAGESGWQFVVTPYVWGSGVFGDVELANGERIEVDTSFIDILGDLKFAAMGAFEVRNDRIVLLGDIIFLSLGSSGTGPAGFVHADVDMSMFIGTALGGYRVVDEGPLFLDLLAGGRVSSLGVEIALTGPLQEIERDKSKTSISPVIGTRFRAPLGDRWGLALYGDLAGFGITSDLTWQLMGTVQFDLDANWRLAAGYRHVAIHNDKQEFDLDLSLSGPIIGASYRF